MRSGAAIHWFGREDYELPDRLEAAYVPPDAGFATKPKLATRMIARAIAASVPFKWVAGDTVYGVGDIEQQLRRAGKGYVLGVSSAHVFRSWGKRSPVRPQTSPGRGAHPTGSACRREPEHEFGLDHNESRSWHGWHRHVSLVMLAFAMMAAIRHRANPPPPKKTKRRPPAKAKA